LLNNKRIIGRRFDPRSTFTRRGRIKGLTIILMNPTRVSIQSPRTWSVNTTLPTLARSHLRFPVRFPSSNWITQSATMDSQHHSHVPFLPPQNRFITSITLKRFLDQTIEVSRFYSLRRSPTFKARPCRSFIRIPWKGSSKMWRTTTKKLSNNPPDWTTKSGEILDSLRGNNPFSRQ
jgi:hypothetical protein